MAKEVTVSIPETQAKISVEELQEEEIWKKKHSDFLNSINNAEVKAAINNPSQTRIRTIRKVPPVLREAKDNFKTYYKPSKVSIGPLHHGRPEFQEVEELKPATAKLFVAEFITLPKEDNVDATFKKFEKKLKEILREENQSIKDLYDDETVKNTFDEDSLMHMMFLDGCFILYFILNYKGKRIGLKNEVKAEVQQDLFLVENQLPFQVLEVLLNLSILTFIGRYMVEDFAGYTYGVPIWKRYKSLQHAKPLHLLDLLWIILLRNDKIIGIDLPQNEVHGKHPWAHISKLLMRFGQMATDQPNHIKRHLFHGVKNLTMAGIYFRPNSSGSLRDINFRSFGICGRLTLPRITIEKSTKQMLMNLIAHELCTANRVGFISYICFLDFLIDHAEDVKELRSARIFDNFLEGDQKVADLFNEIGNEIFIGADLLQEDNDTYEEVKNRMLRYLSNRGNVKIASWVAEVSRDHFKSPWTAIAVLAAIVAISLTFVQTYFTIFPRSK